MIVNANGVNVVKTDEEILNVVPNLASYLAFVGNVNADSLDSAFGQNNESEVYGIGKALAMYAKYKEDSVSSVENIEKCETLLDVLNDGASLYELSMCSIIQELIATSTYANGISQNGVSESAIIEALTIECGITKKYTSLGELFVNEASAIMVSSVFTYLNSIGNKTLFVALGNSSVLATLFANIEDEAIYNFFATKSNARTYIGSSENTTNLKTALFSSDVSDDDITKLTESGFASVISTIQLSNTNAYGKNNNGKKILEAGRHILVYYGASSMGTATYNVRVDSASGNVVGVLSSDRKIIRAESEVGVYLTDCSTGSGGSGSTSWSRFYGI